MNIEDYNRMRNVSSMRVQHNYTIMGGLCDEAFIKKVLNIRAFVGEVRRPVKLLISKTIRP
jgi:hypothetical protein